MTHTATAIRVATVPPTVVFAHSTAPDAALMRPVVNIPGFTKPDGGLWTTPVGAEGWTAWCKGEDFDDWESHEQHLLTPVMGARVAVIGSRADLEALIEVYGYSQFDYGTSTQFRDFIDYEAMAADGWDGVWLTEAGQWATRLSRPANLYGWDTETVLWFWWVFA